MADTYDVIICGAGSGGGFLAGEIAAHGSVLILDAGPSTVGTPSPGKGSPESRRFSTQINLGQFIPDGVYSINTGSTFFAYRSYMDESSPGSFGFSREARVVGGGSHINAGAWVRPRSVDWPDFEAETGVKGWTKEAFEPHFLKAETILHVHRDLRENWNKASLLYEETALSLGIPMFETASNRYNCIFCGQRLNAGMPCKYDALMSTAITQIPKAVAAGATLVDNATVLRVETSGTKATGVTYRRGDDVITANANKLVVLAAGAYGTPLIMFDSGMNLVNSNVGKYLRAHPAINMMAVMPDDGWGADRGYQWNAHHYVMGSDGEPMDVIVHPSANLGSVTPWIASQVGFIGPEYKNLARKYQSMIGALLFQLKPSVVGRVLGSVQAPVIRFPLVDKNGLLEPKVRADFLAGVRQVGGVFARMGALMTFPNPNQPDNVLDTELVLRATAPGIPHPQGTCRAGADRATSVVDSNLMSHDYANLMCCDASVIPKDISSNPNAMIMAIASRASDFVIREILGKRAPENETGGGE
jgi:choline dehydrogenase